jgi:hypothetical protein
MASVLLAQDGDLCRVPSDHIKGENFVDLLSDYQLFKDSVLWS